MWSNTKGIAYQDCKFIGSGKILCTGYAPGGPLGPLTDADFHVVPRFFGFSPCRSTMTRQNDPYNCKLGHIDLIDIDSFSEASFYVNATIYSNVQIMSYKAFWVTYDLNYMLFVPDDGINSTLEVFTKSEDVDPDFDIQSLPAAGLSN